MRLVTAETMRAIDRHVIDVMDIPGLDLMEEAGMGTVSVLVEVAGIDAGRSFPTWPSMAGMRRCWPVVRA